MMYTFLLLRAHVLIDEPEADLLALALAYPATYFLYMVWNQLQKSAYGSVRFTQRPLWAATTAASILVVLYLLAPRLGTSDELRNILFLLLELGIVAAYRHVNWQQQLVLER
jgi:Kef-type K+ transport system membrane component KefB